MLKLLIIFITSLHLFASTIEPIPLAVEYHIKKASLGKKLFSDTILSKDGTISCATCHNLEHNGADTTPYSFGVDGAEGLVNSPTVFNSSGNFVQFWNGRAEDLKAQVIMPITNPVEMADNKENILKKLKNSKYDELFKALYKDGVTIENLSEVVAEFEKALITPNSRFDQYLRGDLNAITAEEKEGFKTFKELGCISCHNGVNVGGNMYQKSGLIIPYLQDKPMLGRFDITSRDRDKNIYKVPSLRNIELTAPYFHDGQVKTLKDAVFMMQKHQLGIIPKKIDTKRITTFLKTLTGEMPRILQESK